MDEKHPNRKKDKHNPYTLMIAEGRYYLSFIDGRGVMPEMGSTLIQSMIVMSVSMGAFIGLPPSLIETYGSDIKKVYKANGVPIYLGLVTMFLSAFVHLMITCIVIVLLAPVLFEAILPTQLPFFFLALLLMIFQH